MESLVIAPQGETLSTRYHKRNIMKQPTDSKCWMCYKAEEQITYIVVGCTTFAPSEFSKHVGLQFTTNTANIYQKES